MLRFTAGAFVMALLFVACDSTYPTDPRRRDVSRCTSLEWGEVEDLFTCSFVTGRRLRFHFSFHNSCDHDISIRYIDNEGRTREQADELATRVGPDTFGKVTVLIPPGDRYRDAVNCPMGEPYVTYCVFEQSIPACSSW